MFFEPAAPAANLLMYRTCVHALGHSVEECESFLAPGKTNHTQELENAVQQYATFVGTAKSVLESAVPALLSVFIGVWSDKHGRKPLLTIPLLGLFMSSVMVVMYSIMPSLGPWWYVVTVIPFSLSGGYVVMITGSMCYVNDISTTEQKSVRLLYIQLAVTISSAAGSAICPFLSGALGNVTYVLLVTTALFAVTYVHIALCLKESLKTATQGTILTVLNIEHVKEMIYVCFRRKPNYGRAISLLVIMASALSVFTTYGISGLMYLYTRNKIHWTMKDYTIFMAIGPIIWLMGSVGAIAVLQPVFRISDTVFSLISFMSVMVEYAIKAFATKTWQMYFGSAISLFGTVSGALLRAIQTKALPAADVAKVFALQSSAEAICPLLAPVLYNMLYAYTIDSFPGAFLLLSTAINVVCFILLSIVLHLMKKSSNTTYQTIEP
ncbi:hypothetical protein evm_011615 [Chilo suppressalis]|nr:hypothetical protein evm_011615 [Chilo suppressalis]